jgi:hypothetical protein
MEGAWPARPTVLGLKPTTLEARMANLGIKRTQDPPSGSQQGLRAPG